MRCSVASSTRSAPRNVLDPGPSRLLSCDPCIHRQVGHEETPLMTTDRIAGFKLLETGSLVNFDILETDDLGPAGG